MIRTYFVILAVFCLIESAHAQSKYLTDPTLYDISHYSKYSKDELWSKTKTWIATSLDSYKYHIDMEDRNGGTIVLKLESYYDNFSIAKALKINLKLRIDIKDGGYHVKLVKGEYVFKPNSTMLRNIEYTSTSVLKSYREDLEIATHISDFSLPEGINFEYDYYNKRLENIPKYKKPKDEAKGRINKEYKECEDVLHTVINVGGKLVLMWINIKTSLDDSLGNSL